MSSDRLPTGSQPVPKSLTSINRCGSFLGSKCGNRLTKVEEVERHFGTTSHFGLQIHSHSVTPGDYGFTGSQSGTGSQDHGNRFPRNSLIGVPEPVRESELLDLGNRESVRKIVSWSQA